MLEVTEHDYDGLAAPGEMSFTITNPEEDGYQKVYIHPWHRYYRTNHESHEVYISVGTYDENGDSPDDLGENNMWNIIVDREDFVEGIIQTFPELKRADV